MRRPVSSWRTYAVVLLLLACLADAGLYLTLRHRVHDRIATGRPLVAEVTVVRDLGVGRRPHQLLITVVYETAGPRSAELTTPLEFGDYRAGEKVTVYVDPRHPGRAATADGFAGEGVPQAVLIIVFLYLAFTLLGIVFSTLRAGDNAPRGREVR